ncbi:MAG: thioredoxin domain-containing protein [Bacteroidia bacterium]
MANHLAGQQSLYLLQHAYQPVAWYPWGDEALHKAQAENKPLLISIGYSSCHWCHVMARESFEDPEIAEVMNTHFVCIKVDKEERPDIDQIYMDAVQVLRGHGGWPLNCFAMPDGRPFFGCTYYPKDRWLQLLRIVADLWKNEPSKVEKMAHELTSALEVLDKAGFSVEELPAISLKEWEKITEKLLSDVDWVYGGARGDTKFPMSTRWMGMLHLSHFVQEGSEALTRAVHFTLEKMAQSGLWDVLEGGFMRYATDRAWRIPHFEKMLYDNAMLLWLYSLAHRHQPKKLYEDTIRGIVDFLQEKMALPGGGWAASLSAESEGQEGKYYLWSYQELREVLPAELQPIFFAYHDIQQEGNFRDGYNHLFPAISLAQLSQTWDLPSEKITEQLQRAYAILRQVRAQRISPLRDDTLIAVWNALVVIGLVEAYRALQETSYVALAKKTALHILEVLWGSQSLQRMYKGKAYVDAFAEDYGALLVALLRLYEVTGESVFADMAHSLMEVALQAFYDPQEGTFFFSPQRPKLILRRKEYYDISYPSSNALLAEALWKLCLLFDNPAWRQKALNVYQRYRKVAIHHPELVTYALIGLLHIQGGYYVVATKPVEAELLKAFLPEIYLWVHGQGVPLLASYRTSEQGYFVCNQDSCLSPVSYAQDFLATLGSLSPMWKKSP